MRILDDIEPSAIGGSVAVGLIAIVVIWFYFAQHMRCEKRGGELVQTFYGWTCVKAIESVEP